MPNIEGAVKRPRRVTWLVAVGGLFIAGSLVVRYYWLARPVGQGPAGPEVPRHLLDKIWTDRPVLLLGIGDSVTATMPPS